MNEEIKSRIEKAIKESDLKKEDKEKIGKLMENDKKINEIIDDKLVKNVDDIKSKNSQEQLSKEIIGDVIKNSGAKLSNNDMKKVEQKFEKGATKAFKGITVRSILLMKDAINDKEILDEIGFKKDGDFKEYLESILVKEIIHSKTLFKKFKDKMHLDLLADALMKKAKLSESIDLQKAGPSVRTLLYKKTKNDKLPAWLTILGPLSQGSKKRVDSIQKIVEKRIKTIVDAVNKEKNVGTKFDLRQGIVEHCKKYLKNKDSVYVYLCLALTSVDTNELVNQIGDELLHKERMGRQWASISLLKINNVKQTPKEFAKSLQEKLNTAIKNAATSKDRKYLDDTEINVGKRPNLDN